MFSTNHQTTTVAPPTISLPLTRYHSRGHDIEASTHLASNPPRPTSPPPRGYRGKTSIFALIRRSGGTLDSVPSASYEDDQEVEIVSKGKGKGKGMDRWAKRASRKAPVPPVRERGESEELDWERIRTLPRVRLVPPEDEGEPVMLYPIPHPSSLLPLPPRPQSPPSLLSATVAASRTLTDPSVAASPPTPPRPTTSSPPSGMTANSLAHATFMAQQHGHWIGMSDKFILPPPVFTRGPSSPGRAAATKGIVMPKTRRQVEADIGKRMSMVEQRKRDSLELERTVLLPPLEEATQSPPNVMMPPVLENDGEVSITEDEDVPLAAIIQRNRPGSPTKVIHFQHMSALQSLPPFDYDISPTDKSTSNGPVPVLGPAFELKELPARSTSRDQTLIADTPPPIMHITAPPVAPIGLPTPPPLKQAFVQPVHPVTRTKRSKSLTAALSRSFSDEGPPAVPTQPPVPMLKKQKSLKKLFFATTDVPPPVPLHPIPPSPTKRKSLETVREQGQPESSKKNKLSRAKSKPSLRIEVKQPTSSTFDGGLPTPALATASSSGQSDSYPLTPALTQRVLSRDDEVTEMTKTPGSAGGIRGLSKRFSLSNMSGAFRKRSSISGMPVPLAAEVPVVPELPAVYRKTAPKAKSKSKGKEKEVVEDDVSIQPIAVSRSSLEERRERPEPEGMMSMPLHPSPPNDESPIVGEVYEPVAGPSRSPPVPTIGAVRNHIGLPSLGTEPFDIIDSDYEFAIPSPPPAQSAEDSAQPLDSARSITTEPMAPFDHFPDPETASLSSCGSLDDPEHISASIIHAQLMQVSPTTRRNPGVSLQEFLGMAPLPQTGVLVASPSEKRRSVEGVILGPLLISESPLRGLASASSNEIEKDKKPKKEVEFRSAAPMVIDLRGQYLKRIGPSGSKGAHQILERAIAAASPPTTPIALASPLPESENGCLPVDDTFDPVEDGSSDDASEPEKEEVPATPLSENVAGLASPIYVAEEPHIVDPESDQIIVDADTSQSSSVDSGLVFVEIPLPPSPPLIEPVSRNAGSRASTPRSRFTTPEALLRLLASPLGASRLSRTNTPSTGGSGKIKKGTISLLPNALIELEGLPLSRDGEMSWSALLQQTQLGSLHFDDLGLDLSFGEERGSVIV